MGPDPAEKDASGSGKWGSPWLRMHLAKASAAANWAFVGLRGPGPPPGRSLPHFLCAAWKAGDCGFNPEPGLISIPPPALGSGKFGTPLARMHPANFSAWSDAGLRGGARAAGLPRAAAGGDAEHGDESKGGAHLARAPAEGPDCRL